VSSEDARIKSLAPSKVCHVNLLLDFMCVDKKNQGNQKKIVMLSGIGKTAEPRATFIPDSIIKKILCSAIAVVPPSASLGSSSAYVNVPGSKSISNRALVLAALGEGVCRLQGLLHSDDVQVMLDALQKIVGIKYTWENDGATLVVTGGAGRLQVPQSEIYLGNAGTASRFLTSVCALIPSDPSAPAKKTVLTGNPRMKQRPIGPLVDALSSNGCAIFYQERQGSLPLVITPSGLKGGLITLLLP
jgi:pentafunctional AROM polypeptide